ncbi:MAG: hypothetical protein ACK5M7_21345 [Draconibacterium sp.]
MKNKKSLIILIVLLWQTIPNVQAANWPRKITVGNNVITMYQPQLETLEGTTLSGRSAISVKMNEESPLFGAVWLTANLETDRSTRIATLTDIKVPAIKFADEMDQEILDEVSHLIETEMPKWDLRLSIDEIITTLEKENGGKTVAYKNDPPEIIISYKPAVLVYIDGDPVLKNIEGSDLQRIENTPYTVLYDRAQKAYFLYGENMWFTTRNLDGKWTVDQNPTGELLNIQKQLEEAAEENDENEDTENTTRKGVIPEIIVTTIPAELIQIDGEPDFSPVKGTELLYVKNSEDNIVMDIGTQSYYILISGRWYSAKKMDGPWSYLDAEDLPKSFAAIPEGSDLDVLLASVPGTNAAREAILDTQIPQTAEIDRNTATVKVEYDGKPEFKKVDGTQMLYAVNSPQTVLKLNKRYYVVDNAVWFESESPDGPWQVATERPEEVDKIEPTSPVYNVKYVNIYEVTPSYVRVGYTPGYYGSYVYGPTVIYGTGYYYSPWYGSYYYPRPLTYGFHMSYNPWTGWGINFGFSYGGWFHFGWSSGYHGGYWGCPGYRPPHYGYHHHHGGYYGHNPRPPHYRPPHRNNIYANNRPGVRPTSNQRRTSGTVRNRDNNRSTRQNNVYTDKSGKVYQQTKKGWETRENNQWKQAGNSNRTKDATIPGTRQSTGNTTTRPTAKPTTQRPTTGTQTRQTRNTGTTSGFNRSTLNRASQNRSRSQQRVSSYNRAAQPGRAVSRQSGASRSGGIPQSRRR